MSKSRSRQLALRSALTAGAALATIAIAIVPSDGVSAAPTADVEVVVVPIESVNVESALTFPWIR